MDTQDSVLPLLDELCRVRAYRVDKDGEGERAIATLIADKLRAFPWLTTVTVEDLGDEIFNVLAYDGDPSEIELLVVGHFDTVVPSSNWQHEEYTDDGERYYALGACDTRGGIAAALDAIGRVGATRKVGYLFYGDEEYQFVGMKEFVRMHPEIAPKLGLSVCGGKGEAYLGWRACTEMEFVFEGVAAHASRPWDGANAVEALAYTMEEVRFACTQFQGESKTSANIASVHAGSLAVGRPYTIGRPPQVPPPMNNVANKVPNVAWALLDVRPGDKGVSSAYIEGVARRALAEWNQGRIHQVSLATIHVNFEMPAYEADRKKVKPLFETFRPVHGGKVSPTDTTGFLDATLIAGKHGTQFMCLSPDGDRQHASDEYTTIAGLVAYRDCMVELLGGYKI